MRSLIQFTTAHQAHAAMQSAHARQSPEDSPKTEDTRELAALQARDREVRQHERAHQAAAGDLASGGASYQMTRGADGRLYATGGEVKIDVSPVANDPEATLEKAQKIRRAALAPANPSQADRNVAARASAMAVEAQVELQREARETNGTENTKESASTHCEQCGGTHTGPPHGSDLTAAFLATARASA